MLPVRIAFDAARPAFVSGVQTLQGRTFADGAELPWRDLGMSELDLLAFWQAGLVYFKADAQPDISPAQPSPPELVPAVSTATAASSTAAPALSTDTPPKHRRGR